MAILPMYAHPGQLHQVTHIYNKIIMLKLWIY